MNATLPTMTGMCMTTEPSAAAITLIRAAYAAFNARRIDAALATMSTSVTWPRAFKGGFVQGHDAVAAYWTEQWSEIDPHVEPIGFATDDAGAIVVTVHQVVRDLTGIVLVDTQVHHRFTMADGLIQSMDVDVAAAEP